MLIRLSENFRGYVSWQLAPDLVVFSSTHTNMIEPGGVKGSRGGRK